MRVTFDDVVVACASEAVKIRIEWLGLVMGALALSAVVLCAALTVWVLRFMWVNWP